MDIKLEKKKGWRAIFQKKNLPYAAVVVLIVFIGWLILRDNSSTLRVDAGLVNIATVEQGDKANQHHNCCVWQILLLKNCF